MQAGPETGFQSGRGSAGEVSFSSVSSCSIPGGDGIFKNIVFQTATNASELFLSLTNTDIPSFVGVTSAKQGWRGEDLTGGVFGISPCATRTLQMGLES